MKFEHFALNVPDAAAMAAWYVEHLDMQIIRSIQEPPHMHFLADATGRVVAEIYTNPIAPVPDYGNQHPLVVHVAFAVEDAAATRDALVAAGATILTDGTTDAGDHLVMLRDPWGVALQLCQRAVPMA